VKINLFILASACWLDNESLSTIEFIFYIAQSLEIHGINMTSDQFYYIYVMDSQLLSCRSISDVNIGLYWSLTFLRLSNFV
jgi:hypothetical protein